MKGIIFLLIISLILETVFYPYPFTLLIVIMTVLAYKADSLFFAFFAGLLLDIFGMKLMGGDSLIFLGIAAFLLRYNRRINFNYTINAMIFVLIATSVYSFVFYSTNFNIAGFIVTIILSLAYLILFQILSPESIKAKKLQL